MNDADVKQIILRNINKLRKSEGYYALKEDKRLAAHAERTVKKIFVKKTLSPGILPLLPDTTFLYYDY